jgi:predicted chitinase
MIKLFDEFSDFVNEAANGQLDPSALTQIAGAGNESSTGLLNQEAAKDYEAMKSAAEADGITWKVTSSYRDYEAQVRVAAEKGLYSKGGLAATPGKSNHGWGSAIDLKLGDKALAWMNDNASKFGFTTIPGEPWHWDHKSSVEFAKTGKQASGSPSTVLIDPDFVTRLMTSLRSKGFSQADLEKFSKKGSEKSTKFSGGGLIPTENIGAIEKAMDSHGITNDFARRAILGVVSKESPNLANEVSYANTPADRIRQVFPSKFKAMSDSQIDAIKKDENLFWEIVYGGKYGNDTIGDGAKYRGRGFNGLTFKGNYKKLQDLYERTGSKLGSINIVENPELLNRPDVAAEFLVLFFLEAFNSKGIDPNGYSDLEDAVKDYVQANAGWGTSLSGDVVSAGLSKAQQFAQSLKPTDQSA